MKIASLTLALAATVLTGCTNLVSLNPFVTEQQAVSDPNLPGTWQGDDRELLVVRPNGAGYSVTYTDGKDGAQRFKALVFRTGGAELLDLVSENDAFLQVPVHALVRVWPEGTQLRWTFVDSKWLRQKTASLASQPNGDGVLLTAPGEAVRTVLLRYAADSQAYEKEANVFTRAPF